MPPPPVSLVPSDHLDPRIRILRCGSIVDTFALISARYLVIIDTMVSEDTMLAGIRLLADQGLLDRPLLVLNTHGDWDHVCGNGIFCREDAPYPAPVIGSEVAAELMLSPDASNFLDALKAEHLGEFDTANIWPPTIRFREYLEIDCGDLSLEFVPTPGHRPGHYAIWVPELRLLFAGDAAESPLPFVEEPDSVPVLRASFERMLELDPGVVLYCHAPGRSDAGVIRENIAYFDELERRCRAYLSAGNPAPDHDDLATALDWPLEKAVSPNALSSSQQPEEGFYQTAHQTAIRSMLAWLKRPATE
jgi:glyoxylase-like metal-dependent hydrolase (beta-lactamase superfamily II)